MHAAAEVSAVGDNADDREALILTDLLDLLNGGTPFSDILLEEDAPVMVKAPGGWERADCLGIPNREDLETLLRKIDTNWEANITERAINRPIDLAGWRLRVNAYLAFGGTKLMTSIRRLPAAEPTLADTGLPQSVRLMIENPSGIILISGATGSGKSTTQAALVDCINQARSNHIITIEDPIEYRFRRKKSIFSQREVGVDCASFFDGVRDAMRQRPDVIVIGEIRDKETAETALLAAESGHLVIGTLHANSAPGAIQKLLSWFPGQDRDAKLQTLAASLVGVISQILLPKKDRSGYALAAELLFNHKQQYSKLLGDQDKLASSLERKEDGISQTMVESLEERVVSGLVAKADALRAIKGGQAVLYERLKTVAA
ncbi:MAG: ATPase, T2SS/T4P/T4SS family [Pseudomonadota bacterium]|jgi:twitching motility protein PilT